MGIGINALFSQLEDVISALESLLKECGVNPLGFKYSYSCDYANVVQSLTKIWFEGMLDICMHTLTMSWMN